MVFLALFLLKALLALDLSFDDAEELKGGACISLSLMRSKGLLPSPASASASASLLYLPAVNHVLRLIEAMLYLVRLRVTVRVRVRNGVRVGGQG